MPSATTTWGIPFPNNVDSFAQGAAYTAAIGERVDALVNLLAIDVARIVTPPYAALESNTTQTTTTTAPQQAATFTQVNADTGSYTNMTNDNTAIVIPPVPASTVTTGGRYLINGYMRMSWKDQTFNTTGQFVEIITNNGVATSQSADRQTKQNMVTRTTAGVVQHMANVDTTTGSATFQLQEYFGPTPWTGVNIDQARFLVLWIADE